MSERRPIFADIEQILGALPDTRIGVVGDFCLDFYQFVDLAASEISVETGLATLPVREVRYSLGGAGNVVNNLCAMGVRGVRCYGVVGHDPHGELLVRLLKEAGADPGGLLVQEKGWLTQTYTKVMVGDEEKPRIDWGNFNELSSSMEARLIDVVQADIGTLDLLIINQQLVHGIHCAALRKELARLASAPGAPTVITDSRDYSDEYTGSVRKLNEEEGRALCDSLGTGTRGAPGGSDGKGGSQRVNGEAGEAHAIAATLFERWHRPVLLTRGDRGCLVCDREGIYEAPGLVTRAKIDPVGAGDSMLAGTAATLATGHDLRRAAELGNLVAAVTVQKLHQTGTASPEEIREFAKNADYRYRPELAHRADLARYHEASEIEVVTELPKNRHFAHAIFDNDGTISVLRQGWEEVMEPVMVRAILGASTDQVSEKIYRSVAERVHDYVDRTTGVQTIVQMHGLVELVREFGFIPEDKVLTAEGYKAIYNTGLMAGVNRRIRRIESGELSPEDFLLKGALGFIASLVRNGVKVYLASGTDDADVRRETDALGYASLFGEAIYGSVGDVHNDPKKKVIEKILSDITGSGADIVTFGDGPVEIRETRRRGGYAVGVASDEVRRFGLNPSKRTRLIEAGTDLIIPDFSQADRLFPLLFGDNKDGTPAV